MSETRLPLLSDPVAAGDPAPGFTLPAGPDASPGAGGILEALDDIVQDVRDGGGRRACPHVRRS